MKHLKMKHFGSDSHKQLKFCVHSVSNRAMLNSTSNYITITVENELCIGLKHIFSVTMIAMIDTCMKPMMKVHIYRKNNSIWLEYDLVQ